MRVKVRNIDNRVEYSSSMSFLVPLYKINVSTILCKLETKEREKMI